MVAGREHTLAITEHGTIMVWGNNRWGQLGLCGVVPRSAGQSGVCFPGDASSKFEDSLVPVVVPALHGIKIVDVAAGAYHTIAISFDGDVYAWGDNTYHQLGNRSVLGFDVHRNYLS